MKHNYFFLRSYIIIIFMLFSIYGWGQVITGECAHSNCENGATCIDVVGGHECRCKLGFVGATCGFAVESPAAAIATVPSTPNVVENDVDVVLSDDFNINFGDETNEELYNSWPYEYVPNATFTITGGTLSLGNVTEITFTSGKNGSSSFTASGSTTAINAALRDATFTPLANLSGTAVAGIKYKLNPSYDNYIPASNEAEVTFDIISNNTCIWSEWNEWTICDNGSRSRTRTCIDPGTGNLCENCEGNDTENQLCVDGGWSEWSEWGPCIKGSTIRTRTCTNPTPLNGGSSCFGSEVDRKSCDIDGDGDGFVSSLDCDDNDPSINPGAVEICDGLDNNCDGQIDELVGTIYYVDADVDGYGDEKISGTLFCSDPGAGWSLNNSDCDDDTFSGGSIFPGATEVCDGFDNNCNGVIDEGFDADLDGTSDCVDNCPTDANKIEPGDCGCGIQDLDSDSDGIPNCIDECPNDPNKTLAGDCGCKNEEIDSDSDGISDCIDVCDGPDIDSDNDGTADCNDLCPNDANKTEPGGCGCGIQDLDDDNDGILNCMETDDDDDGVLNCNDNETSSPCPDIVDEFGVSKDSDGDGYLDCNDTEIHSPCPDVVDQYGVSPKLDSDSDGIIDCLDAEKNSLCPDIVDVNGVSLDSDGDGIPDCVDTCEGVIICHVKKNGETITMCVTPKQLEKHLKHTKDNLNGECIVPLTGKSQYFSRDITSKPLNISYNSLKIVPNPASNVITVMILEEVSLKAALSIFNMNGILIETRPLNGQQQLEIELGNKYTSGMYVVIIEDSHLLLEGKFLAKK